MSSEDLATRMASLPPAELKQKIEEAMALRIAAELKAEKAKAEAEKAKAEKAEWEAKLEKNRAGIEACEASLVQTKSLLEKLRAERRQLLKHLDSTEKTPPPSPRHDEGGAVASSEKKEQKLADVDPSGDTVMQTGEQKGTGSSAEMPTPEHTPGQPFPQNLIKRYNHFTTSDGTVQKKATDESIKVYCRGCGLEGDRLPPLEEGKLGGWPHPCSKASNPLHHEACRAARLAKDKEEGWGKYSDGLAQNKLTTADEECDECGKDQLHCTCCKKTRGKGGHGLGKAGKYCDNKKCSACKAAKAAKNAANKPYARPEQTNQARRSYVLSSDSE